MSAVIAGWVAGYSTAIIWTIAFMYLLMRAKTPTFLERLLAGAPTGLAAVPLSLGMTYGWTIIGLSVGIIYKTAGLGDAPGFLGSPSAPMLYTSAILSVIPLPFVILTWPRRWWLWVTLSASFLGLWGWAMPIMAER